MPTLHMTASGKICQDASTRRLKKHDAACCETCNDCLNNDAPASWKVGIDNIRDDDCSSCANYNDTSYVVPYVAGCIWTANITDHCSVGGTPRVQVEVLDDVVDPRIYVRIFTGTGGQICQFYWENATQPDCPEIDETSVGNRSVSGAGTDCDFSAATCTRLLAL